MSADYFNSFDFYVRRKREKKDFKSFKKEFEDAVKVKCDENKNENKKEESDEKKEFEDILSDPVTYELQVNKSRIKCSKRVIASSHLLLDMIDLTDPKDYSPIRIPSFITKQIILDLVEMVEKGDMECAHLVLVSLSYLLDFLIAVDFLCCDKLKASVEEKIREKIDETNWREVLAYTKDIIGLENTTRAALEPIIKSVDKYYLEASLDLDHEHEDPWSGDYCGLSVPVFKLVLRSKLPLIHEKTKIHMLRNWVAVNSFLSHQAAVFEMLRCLDLKELIGSMKEVTAMVNSWPLTEEQFSTFSSMVSRARREQEEESDKRKRMRLSSRFGDPEEWTERQRDFFQRHPQLLERHREMAIMFQIDQDHNEGPGGAAGPSNVLRMFAVGGGQVEAADQAQHMMPPGLEASDDSDAELEYYEMLNDQDHLDVPGGPNLWLDL